VKHVVHSGLSYTHRRGQSKRIEEHDSKSRNRREGDFTRPNSYATEERGTKPAFKEYSSKAGFFGSPDP
jgi:hypothetical protein